MRFIIVGFGRVGRKTAQTLKRGGHETTVVDSDADKIRRAEEAGFDAVGGDGGDERVLESAGVSEADALGALTDDPDTNVSACVVADAHGARTLLRTSEGVDEELDERDAESVDEMISPERLGAAGVKAALLGGDINVITDLTEQLSVASVEIPAGSPLLGERVVDIELPGEARIYAHGRAGESMTIPLPQVCVEAGDSVAVMSDPEQLADVRERLRGEELPA